MTYQRRTPQVLRDASKHLTYEFWMLTSLAHAMSSGVFGQGALANAVLESFAMHARTLLDFLYAQNPQPDDIVADDYFDDSEQWARLRPEKTDVLKGIHRRINKEVAHLTYIRLEVMPEAKDWPIVQIADEIARALDVFRQNVSEGRLDPSWRSAAKRGEGEISGGRGGV